MTNSVNPAPLLSKLNMDNILCVDVEEWYHPEYVKPKVFGKKVSRIEQNIETVIKVLDDYNIKATFFVVGEIAEALPEIIHTIKKNGHEIAFHGYHHEPLWELTPDVFRMQVNKYNQLIESITGHTCLGFRAPSYSLDKRTNWAIEVLEEAGLAYDSSVFPIRTPLYGEASAPITPYHPAYNDIAEIDDSRKFLEFPALVYPLAGFKIPAAGGFYLRTLPLFMLKRAIRKMNNNGFPAVFTFHTWELDPDMPRLKLGLLKSFVTYHNVPVTEKLCKLISAFSFTNFETYLEKNHLL